jgi:hypothetical protein
MFSSVPCTGEVVPCTGEVVIESCYVNKRELSESLSKESLRVAQQGEPMLLTVMFLVICGKLKKTQSYAITSYDTFTVSSSAGLHNHMHTSF